MKTGTRASKTCEFKYVCRKGKFCDNYAFQITGILGETNRRDGNNRREGRQEPQKEKRSKEERNKKMKAAGYKETDSRARRVRGVEHSTQDGLDNYMMKKGQCLTAGHNWQLMEQRISKASTY